MPKPPITDVIYDRLASAQPESLETLGAAAKELGLTTARDPAAVVRQRLRHDDRFVELPDNSWTTLLRLLEGRWLTHRVRESELRGRALRDGLDLGVAFPAIRDGIPLVTGGTAQVRRDYMIGEGDWLPARERGDLIGVTFNDGRLRVTRLDDAELSAADGIRVADAVRAGAKPAIEWRYGSCPSLAVTSALRAALAGDASLLVAPVLPVSELVPEAAERPATEWHSDDPDGCHVSIDEGCNRYRCNCYPRARLSMDLDVAQVYEAEERLHAGGVPLAEHLACAVRAALFSAGVETAPSGVVRTLRSL